MEQKSKHSSTIDTLGARGSVRQYFPWLREMCERRGRILALWVRFSFDHQRQSPADWPSISPDQPRSFPRNRISFRIVPARLQVSLVLLDLFQPSSRVRRRINSVPLRPEPPAADWPQSPTSIFVRVASLREARQATHC